jgi:hypothetical protein
MLRRVVIVCAMLMAFAMVSQAEAGVPIPCTGSRVYQTQDLGVMKGQAVVLYYTVGCWGGNWHQYRTPDGRYLYFSQEALAKLPKPPGFWETFWAHKLDFWVEWLWLVLTALVVFFSALCKVTGVDPNDPAHLQAARRR